MATYYVAGASGSDGAAGTATGTAWATIDKAANTVAAGDTVWIKPGVYRELVTMDTAGSSGSSITYNGDFEGAKFGVVGPVIISAWDDDTGAPTRASCWDMNGKGFIVVNKIQFHGGTSFAVGNTAFASGTAYEGCEFNDCLFQASENDFSFQVELNVGTTPTSAGLTMRRCAFIGAADVMWDSNGTANVNLKMSFERCFYITGGFDFGRVANGGAFTVGGITINHSCFIAAELSFTYVANTTDPIVVGNCQFIRCSTAVSFSLGTVGAVVVRNCINSGYAITTFGTDVVLYPDRERHSADFMVGGLHDWLYYKTFGWSPWKPWEPMNPTGFTNPAIDYGTLDITASNDIYGHAAMGRPSVYGHLYYFDGSDAAVSDPNAVWTTESNITDTSLTTLGTSSTNGSTSSNYVMAEGTNAPSGSASIVNVYARMNHKWGTSNASNAGELKIYTDALGELLATIAHSTTGTTQTWTSWAALTTPSGGWTWAKVQALEFKAYRTAGATTFQIAQIQVYVATAEDAPDAGMVESRTRIAQESSTVHAGTYSGAFSGAGYTDLFRPVNAASTTVTVYCRKDGNYSGTNPKMEVVNIPGVADQSDSLSVASGNWEQLSVTFTPTSAGIVRVRLWSYDTSATGKCFFDDLVVA